MFVQPDSEPESEQPFGMCAIPLLGIFILQLRANGQPLTSLHHPQMKAGCVKLVQSTTILSHKEGFSKPHVDGESPIRVSLHFSSQPMKPFSL